VVTLILGPVRAGKTARAAALARASGKRVVLAATAAVDPNDAEMRDRVERHRRDRPPHWTVVETAEPGNPSLADMVRDAAEDVCVIIDALGTWIAAQLLAREADADRDPVTVLDALDALGAELAQALAHARADVIVIAEEAGWGVIPPSALGRIFRDALGRLTRALARRADRVELVVAGYALDVRALGILVDEV
jgi:adenosylcobinamide kinase/adenosylcobinamide-phosphate guanylyltransferase